MHALDFTASLSLLCYRVGQKTTPFFVAITLSTLR